MKALAVFVPLLVLSIWLQWPYLWLPREQQAVPPGPAIAVPALAFVFTTQSGPPSEGQSNPIDGSNERSVTQEIKKRVEEAGGKIGDVTITLKWDNSDDLDLHVVTGNNEEIYYKEPHDTSTCGGKLDVDRNADENVLTSTPVENIRWLKSDQIENYPRSAMGLISLPLGNRPFAAKLMPKQFGPKGPLRVYVVNYKSRAEDRLKALSLAAPFTMRFANRDVPTKFTVLVKVGSMENSYHREIMYPNQTPQHVIDVQIPEWGGK